MTREELLEAISAVVHDAWEDWSKEVASEVSEERKAGWEENWVPYDQLDESTKDLDREWAMEILDVIGPALMSEDQEAGPPEPTALDVSPEEVEVDPASEPEAEDVKSAKKKALEMITKVEVDSGKYPSIAKILKEKRGKSMLAKVRANAKRKLT